MSIHPRGPWGTPRGALELPKFIQCAWGPMRRFRKSRLFAIQKVWLEGGYNSKTRLSCILNTLDSFLLKRPYGLVPPTCFISHEQHIIDANSSQRPLSRWELSDCNVMGLRYIYMSRWCYEFGILNEDMYYWNTDEVSDMSPPAES